MRETAISFPSSKLTLDGVISLPLDLDSTFPMVVVCHSHPLFGGAMDEPIVLSICQALTQRGIASLRFNFRGAGERSVTKTAMGKEEHQDVKAALAVAKGWPGIDGGRIGLAGYSFGASVILAGLSSLKTAKALVLISPTLPSFKRSSIGGYKAPKLFMVGERDRLVPVSELEDKIKTLPPPVECQVLPDADHSLRGFEGEIGNRVGDFFYSIFRRKD